jgi:hypothetical protein
MVRTAANVVELVRIADPAHRDVAALGLAPGSSHCTRGDERRPEPAAGDGPLQQCFPIERFQDLEQWIVERSAKVRREMAAQGATWTAPGRASEGERGPA